MNKIYILVILLLSIVCNLRSEDVENVVIGKIDFGKSIDSLSEFKVVAALNLTLEMTGKYKLVDQQKIDSAFNYLKSNNISPTAIEVSKYLDAQKIIFVRVNKLENLLRVDLRMYDADNLKKYDTGKGYSFINFKLKESNKSFYDPALLKATQRAFAYLVKDSNIFENQNGIFKVRPAGVLSIGGVEYSDTTNLPPLSMFTEKIIGSFQICDYVIEALEKCDNYVMIDIDTRDSMYALNKLFGIENYTRTSEQEINALEKLDVKYLITCKIKRVQEGAIIQLVLSNIHQGLLYQISESTETVLDDKKDTIKKVINKLSLELTNCTN